MRGKTMTGPTSDDYDRYRPQQEQPTQSTQPMQTSPEPPTRTMPPAQEQPAQAMPLRQPNQRLKQIPFQVLGQQPIGGTELETATTPAPNGEVQVEPSREKRDKGKKKTWYKHPWVWIVVAVVLILGLAFGQGGLKDTLAPASNTLAPASNKSTQPSKEIFDLQTLVGKKWDEASQTLTEHHWTAHDYMVQTDEGKTPVLGENWTVASVSADTKPVISLKHDSAQAAPDAPKTDSSVPHEYSSALAKADYYSRVLRLSRQKIYEELTDEYGYKFSPEAAQYATEHLKADYNANALANAKYYHKKMHMTPEAIRKQLTRESGDQFTPDEANYAIQHLND